MSKKVDPKRQFANFGLLFQKFYPYDNKPDSKGIPHLDSVTVLVKKYRGDVDLLNSKHSRQENMLACWRSTSGERAVLKLSSRLCSRLITGIGEVSPSEVGMVFDRNSGLPYIPSASIKGVVRAYTVNFARQNQALVREGRIDEKDVPGLVELFGTLDTSESTRGGVVFMDSFATEVPQVVADVMTPHFLKYYSGDNQYPVENESPLPIKFLAVEKNTDFSFCVFFLTEKAEKYRKELIEAFQTALSEFGIGAKTAAGYGRFEIPADISDTLIDVEEIRKQEAEAKAKEKEDRKYPWRRVLHRLPAIQNWGALKTQVLEHEDFLQHQKEHEVGSAVKKLAMNVAKLNPKKWDAERDSLVADWLEHSSVEWENISSQNVSAANPMLLRILTFSGPSDYERSLNFADLNLECCRALVPSHCLKNGSGIKRRKLNPSITNCGKIFKSG